MDCGRVEQLIALHVGGDLAPEAARSVSSHLQTCEHCRRVADDFAASRELLRAHEPPEFDAAFFDGIRRNVLREIKSAPARNSFASLFSRLLNRKALAYAASVALIVVAGTLAFRFIGGRTDDVNGSRQVAESSAPGNGGERPLVAGETPTRDAQPPAAATPRPSQHEIVAVRDKRRAVGKSASKTPRVVRGGVWETNVHPSVVENVASVTSPPANVSGHSEVGVGAHEVASSASQQIAERKMLRIELQTGDPNVRIIWLTPQAEASTNK